MISHLSVSGACHVFFQLRFLVQVAAAQAVAGAMNAVLPGIDANDERKTRAVFRFYCVILASVGELKAGRCPQSRPVRPYPFLLSFAVALGCRFSFTEDNQSQACLVYMPAEKFCL